MCGPLVCTAWGTFLLKVSTVVERSGTAMEGTLVFRAFVRRSLHSMVVASASERNPRENATFLSHAEHPAQADLEAGSLEGGEVAQPAQCATAEDTRLCRICYENGGADLIAPCHCDGSVKWVHRSCLDRWRVDGANSLAFTNCPQCGFSYLLVLQRAPTESEQQANERRRRFLRRIVREFVTVAVAVQTWLCLVAVCIRAGDPEETLVKVFGLPQVESAPEETSFLNSLRYHKSTYYLAAVLLSAFLVGLGTVVFLLFSECGSRGPTNARAHNYHGHTATSPEFATTACVDCCCDCLECCEPRNCPNGHELDGCCKPCNSYIDASGYECREFAGLMILLVVITIVIGVFVVLMTAVVWLHKVIQRFYQLRELRVLTGEYVVQDLSEHSAPEPSFRHASAPPQMELPELIASAPRFDSPVSSGLGSPTAHLGSLLPYAPVTAPATQQSLTRDLQAVYGLTA